MTMAPGLGRSSFKVQAAVLFFSGILVLLLILLGRSSYFSPSVCLRKTCVRAELADTPAERSRGLMFRRHLASGQGMLFIFPCDDLWGFWMKNTLIALDIIWLDQNRDVVHIVENARPALTENPPIFMPAEKARYVLEVSAGFVREHRIALGQRARFRWIFLPKKI